MLFDVDTVKESWILSRHAQLVQVFFCCAMLQHLATHDSLNEIARAADQDVRQATKSIKGSEKLVRCLYYV